jgi:predicted nucleic acid-binding Zn ribbon protein
VRKRIDIKTRLNRTICLKDELDDFMKYIDLDARMHELKILKVWKECVGETIAKFSIPIELKRNKLLVSVENSVWRYELSSRKTEIIEKLNENLSSLKKRKVIKEIIFI